METDTSLSPRVRGGGRHGNRHYNSEHPAYDASVRDRDDHLTFAFIGPLERDDHLLRISIYAALALRPISVFLPLLPFLPFPP